MKGNYLNLLEKRRSCYELSNDIPLSDDELLEMTRRVVLNTPSAFNSQSTRILLLVGERHAQFWNIVKIVLSRLVPADAFHATEKKIDVSFASGYGTFLFYEDMSIIEELCREHKIYSGQFPTWAEHTNAMHQFAIWTALTEYGLGASLQHYNPIIDDAVREVFEVKESWKLIAQMPFGKCKGSAGDKTFLPVNERMLMLG